MSLDYLLDKKPCKTLNLWYETENQNIKILTLNSGIVEINKTAAMIWFKIDGLNTTRDIINDIYKDFKHIDINRIKYDVCITIERLIQMDIITIEWHSFLDNEVIR